MARESTLTFRDTGKNHNLRGKILFFTVLFFLSVACFSVALNYRGKEEKQVVEPGTLPILSVEAEGIRMAGMHGYISEMDGCYMRESLVPVGKDRKLSIFIKDFGKPATDLSYEIRSLDTERKISEEKIEKLEKDGEERRSDITLTNLLEEGEEYLLIITLKAKGSYVKYYTRVMLSKNEHISDCLEFAEFFHDTAISGDASALSAYLEPEGGTDEETLSSVTIHSTLSQISWKAFEGELASEPSIRFSEIGNDHAAIIYDYQRYDEEKNIYNINEYFKVRYTSERMYLLDYKRTMEEVPRDSFGAMANVLAVGVTDNDFRYLSNDTGTVAAFVQAGDLFLYNENTGLLRRIFSFRGKKNITEEHANYGQHGIRIFDIDENGALDFAVYGYMNGGKREGENGISLYHYDVGENMVREQAFISVKRPYPILEESFSELLYKSTRGAFYVMMDGTLTRIDSQTAVAKEMLTGLQNEQYAVSYSGRYIAWIEEDSAAKEIKLMDLEDESSFSITTNQPNTLLRPMAFLEDDLSYGYVRKGDIGIDAAGNQIYPCYRVDIKDISKKKGKILKKYEKPGFFVTEITANSYTLFMSRVSRSEDLSYEKVKDDTIQDSSGEPNKAVSLFRQTDPVKGVITGIIMAQKSDLEELFRLKIRNASLSGSDTAAVCALNVSDVHESYYVYVGNEVVLATTKVASAIKMADRRMGVVINNKQTSIWNRTRQAYAGPFMGIAAGASDAESSSSAKALSALLVYEGKNVEVHSLLDAGQSPMQILSDSLRDATILDLSGISLSEALYFINCGSPVYARSGADEAVLLTGYDAANVYIFDPDKGQSRAVRQEEAEESFIKNGNVFISYIKP